MSLPELSDRDRECLRMLADGHKDEHIASHLGIAARTVRFHIDRIKRSFNATSRVHMIALALRANLLSLVLCVT
jgi:two-component system nitrate/nitrite response regulator NarL